ALDRGLLVVRGDDGDASRLRTRSLLIASLFVHVCPPSRVVISMDSTRRSVVTQGLESLAATPPGAVALPFVQRPGHVVLVVFGRVARVDADELAPAGMACGRVPRALGELVRAVVRPRRVVGLVVAVALDPARAHEERVVVMGMLAGAGYVVAQVEARGGWRAGGGTALVLRREQLAVQTLLLALELGDEIRLLRLGVLQLALASLKTVAHLPVLPGGGVVTCVEVVEQDGPARPVHPRRLVAEQHRDRRPGALVRLDRPYLGVAAQHGELLLE